MNNAGIVGEHWVDDFLNVDDYQRLIDVNTLGVIRMTHAFKFLVKKAKGRIITVTSIYGRISGGGIGPYTVSKFATEAYCDTLR